MAFWEEFYMQNAKKDPSPLPNESHEMYFFLNNRPPAVNNWSLFGLMWLRVNALKKLSAKLSL